VLMRHTCADAPSVWWFATCVLVRHVCVGSPRVCVGSPQPHFVVEVPAPEAHVGRGLNDGARGDV